MLDMLNRKENVSMFESFSDLALCTLSVSLLLVALLAINATKRIDVELRDNHFTKEAAQPELYLACSTPDISKTSASEVDRLLYGDTPYVAVHLLDADRAQPTDEKHADTDHTVALEQRYNLPLYLFLMMAPGIDPSSATAGGRDSILPAPALKNRYLVYDNGEAPLKMQADAQVVQRLLDTIWPDAPAVEGEESAPTRIYVETRTETTADGSENHFVVIGHCSYPLPASIHDGSLAWLEEFMSGEAEIVYLGETWNKPEQHTNKRIAFFEQQGFEACAEAYRTFLSTAASPADERVAALQQLGYTRDAAMEKTRWANAQQRVSAAMIDGSFSTEAPALLPPLLAHPDAWAAYVAACEDSERNPPEWFYSEFLSAIGFDRMSIRPAANVEAQ